MVHAVTKVQLWVDFVKEFRQSQNNKVLQSSKRLNRRWESTIIPPTLRSTRDLVSQLSYMIQEVKHKPKILWAMMSGNLCRASPQSSKALLLQQQMLTQRDALQFAMRLESNSGLVEALIPGMAIGLVQFQYKFLEADSRSLQRSGWLIYLPPIQYILPPTRPLRTTWLE